MIGHNQVWISGNVGGSIKEGYTRDKSRACSFSVASESDGRGITWVRINAYGDLASECLGRLHRGSYCSLIGELMNRDGKHGEITEVRAKQVIFHESKETSVGKNKTDESKGCTSCGSDQVMLTEEKNSIPRCAGCGKPLPPKKASK